MAYRAKCLNSDYEKKPANPVKWPPAGYEPYKVCEKESKEDWFSIARAKETDAKKLLEINFGTTDPPTINWYLHHYVGCDTATQDGKNWMFSSSANPGYIFVPVSKPKNLILIPRPRPDGGPELAFLTITSETGFPHSAVLLEYVRPVRRLLWLGFFPSGEDNFVLGSRGLVDTGDREKDINHYLRFAVTNRDLDASRRMVRENYGPEDSTSDNFYVAGVRDCVSLSADVARVCGLTVAPGNLSPFGLLTFLRLNNKFTHYDQVPYPWKI